MNVKLHEFLTVALVGALDGRDHHHAATVLMLGK
jgi:hypothetical protein